MSDDPDRRPEDDGPSWAPFGPGADEGTEPAGEAPAPAEPDRPAAPAGDATGGLWSSGDPLDAAPSPGPEPPPPAERPAGPSPWAPPEAPRMDPGAQGWAPPSPPPGSGSAPRGTWPPPALPAPGPGGAGAVGRTAGNATASLVLGIIGLFICPVVCSVAAIVLGLRARREIAATPGLGGRGAAGTGIALGVIGIAVFIVGLIVGFAGIAGSTL